MNLRKTIILAVIVLMFLLCPSVTVFARDGYYLNQWEYNLDINQPGNWVSFTNDISEKIDKFDWVWFRTKLPADNIWGEQAKLIFPAYNNDFEIFMDNSLIYKSYETFNNKKRIFVESYNIVDLPAEFNEEFVYYKVNMRDGPVGFSKFDYAFTNAVINTMEGYKYNLLIQNKNFIFSLVIALLFGVLMIFASFALFRKQKLNQEKKKYRKVLLIVGGSLLFYSLSLFANQDLQFFLREKIYLWHYFAFLFFIISSLFVYYMKHLVEKSQLFSPLIPKIQSIIIKGVLVYAALIFLLDIFRVSSFYSFYRITNGVYLLFMLFNLVLVIYGDRKGDIKFKILSRGLKVAIIAGVFQSVTILIGRAGTARVNQWSTIIFVIALFFTIVYEYFETFYELSPR